MIHPGADWCFACGAANPYGLKLDFTPCGDGVRAKFVLEHYYQGPPGVAHGGIAMTVLDEAAAQAVACRVGPAVTVEMQVEWQGFVPLERELEVEAHLVQQDDKQIKVEARLLRAGGRTVAQAHVKMMLVGQRLIALAEAHQAEMRDK